MLTIVPSDRSSIFLETVVLQCSTGSLSNDDDNDALNDAKWKMNFYSTSEICGCLDLFGTPIAPKTCLSQICNDGLQFQMEIRKISCRPRSVDGAERGHFTLLFCRGRQRNVLFIKPLVSVVLVVCLSSLITSLEGTPKQNRTGTTKIRKFRFKVKWNCNFPENPYGNCRLPPEVVLFFRSERNGGNFLTIS